MSIEKNELSVLFTFKEKGENYLLYDVLVEFSNDFQSLREGERDNDSGAHALQGAHQDHTEK